VEDHLVAIAEGDYGDAPSPYPTTLAADGARHRISWGMRLGSDIDSELDGQPNLNASGDDNDGNDDEDGVTFTFLPIPEGMIPGQLAAVDVTAVVSSGFTMYLNAWIDFNRDGDWADAGEQIITDEAVSSPGGAMTLNFTVPSNASPGTTYARFRLCANTGDSYTGLSLWGEVEDYRLEILELDYGDAPDPSFPTLFASDGARHVIAAGAYMGSDVDADADGQPNIYAAGDDDDGNDDEDGVSYGKSIQGEVADLSVDVSVDGYLNAWMDFNDDGDWTDSGEQIFTNEQLTAGSNNLEHAIPADSGRRFPWIRGRAVPV
jgi:hypothetical protein